MTDTDRLVQLQMLATKIVILHKRTHHHHASLLKIINKTGSLFRGLGALRHFLSLSLSVHFLWVQSTCMLLLDSVSRFRPRM
jgi:hypothetical protein